MPSALVLGGGGRRGAWGQDAPLTQFITPISSSPSAAQSLYSPLPQRSCPLLLCLPFRALGSQNSLQLHLYLQPQGCLGTSHPRDGRAHSPGIRTKTLMRTFPTGLPPKPKNAITVAVSSRALFNMVEDSKIFENEGLEKYMEYQINNENVILSPGPAFGFVKALQNVNARLRSLYPNEQDLFDIVLMTNNHAQVGVRLINSINHHGLLIDRFCLTGGESPIGYLKAYLTNLYLSADSDKVQEAIEEGIAAATMYLGNKDLPFSDTQLRVAFDGDALLFSDDFEQNVNTPEPNKTSQQDPFSKDKPLAQGPLKQFLEDLGRLQKKFYTKNERLLCPIRTYLITARSAATSGARVLKTLHAWGLEIDEALFLAGAPKGPILAKIRPHIFFDDNMFHTKEVQKFGTIIASVPFLSSLRAITSHSDCCPATRFQ
uniref:5'-nucleotidase, cytosolic IB n=1 Tax=Vombatus ursinus TaxID=29139 RepID=A0A4X2M4A1_VOMUR